MGRFTFISYEGDDSGEILVKMTSDEEITERDVHELIAETERRVIGFQPNPEDDDEEIDDDDEGDVQP